MDAGQRHCHCGKQGGSHCQATSRVANGGLVAIAADADAQRAAHQVVRQGVEIVEPGDVPQFVLHDGQQIDLIDGPRIHGLQLLGDSARL